MRDADEGGYEEPAPEYAPPPPAAPGPDYAAELQKLASIINDADFEAKKKQILGV
jgi:hypothetical protein